MPCPQGKLQAHRSRTCTIGILHGRESERGMYPAFALDRMEPMRPVIDRAILELIKTTTFFGGDFAIQPDGVCRLNPELARRVVQLADDRVREHV
jgi:CRISPR-associated protein Cas1